MTDPPLPGFRNLNDLISLHQPKLHNASTTNSHPTDPALIILCSWVGAAPKHIAKYTDTHRRLYPQATILLIQSTVSSMMVETDLDPAYDVLLTTSRTNNSAAPVLLHAFSNGGARTASRLALGMIEHHPHFRSDTTSCPFDTIVFDCCPGTATLASTAKAISISLPGWHVLRSLGYVAVYALAVIFTLLAKVLRWEDSITLLRRDLNDPGVVPVTVPRLYLYSKTDALVAWVDVGRHAAQARGEGYRVVREEVFQRGMHCALVQEDAERYWDAVQEVVRCSGRGKG